MRNNEVADTSFIISPMRSVEGIQLCDGARPIAASTYLADMRRLCLQAGHTGTISSKSPKIAGTSACYAAGMSTLDVQSRGRWEGERTSLHYRQQTPAYRRRIGTATSMFKPMGDSVEAEEETGIQQQGRRRSKKAAKRQEWRREIADGQEDREISQLGKRNRRDKRQVLSYSEQERLDNLQELLDERDELRMRQEELKEQKEQQVWECQQLEKEQQDLMYERGLLINERMRLTGRQWRLEKELTQHKKEKEELVQQLKQLQQLGPERNHSIYRA